MSSWRGRGQLYRLRFTFLTSSPSEFLIVFSRHFECGSCILGVRYTSRPFVSIFVCPSVCSETKQSQSCLWSEYPCKPSVHAASSSARIFIPNASCIRLCRSTSSWTLHMRVNAMLWGSVRCEFRRASVRPSLPCSKICTCVRIWAVGSSYFCDWYVVTLAAAFCVAKDVIWIPTFVWRTWELKECGVERGSLLCYVVTVNWNNLMPFETVNFQPPQLLMSGAVPLLPLHAVVTRTGSLLLYAHLTLFVSL